jgi:hypothetical protein
MVSPNEMMIVRMEKVTQNITNLFPGMLDHLGALINDTLASHQESIAYDACLHGAGMVVNVWPGSTSTSRAASFREYSSASVIQFRWKVGIPFRQNRN